MSDEVEPVDVIDLDPDALLVLMEVAAGNRSRPEIQENSAFSLLRRSHQSTIARVLMRLERRGLVEELDERTQRKEYATTPEGASVLKRVRSRADEAMDNWGYI